LLDGLIESLPTARVLLLVNYRPEYQHGWSGKTYYVQLRIDPLAPESAQALLNTLLGEDRTLAPLKRVLIERTEGNPFFLEESVRSLVETTVLLGERGAYRMAKAPDTWQIPATAQAILAARIDRLAPEDKRLLQTAAVIGKDVPLALLQAITDLPEEDVRRGLTHLQAAEFLYETSLFPDLEYTFKHALTQEVAYETLLLQRRKILHGLVGVAIEAIDPHRLEDHAHLLQRHFSHAENWAKAVHYGLQTVRKAAKLSMFLEAATTLDHVQTWASRLSDNQARQKTLIDILLQKERVYHFIGWSEQQQAVIDQLRVLLQVTEDRALLTEVSLRQGELYTHLARFDEAERALSDALAMRRALSDAAGESAALKSMGFLRLQQGLLEQALTCNESALAIDRQRGDATACVADLSNVGVVLQNLGEYDRALAYLNEALQLCEATEDVRQRLVALYHIGHIHRKRGDLDRALAHYQRCYDIGLREGHANWQGLALEALAAVHWEQGSTDESLRLYENAVHVIRRSQSKQRLSPVLSRQAELLLAANRPRDAVPYLLEAAELFAELRDPKGETAVWERLATIYEETMGNYQRALASWDAARTLRTEMEDRRGALEALRQMARLAHHRLGEPAEALGYVRAALDLAVELDDRPKYGELLSRAANLEWHSAAYADALAHYEEALRVYRELGDLAHAGLMLNSIGVTLRALARYDEALVQLRVAVGTNEEAGQRLLQGHGLAAMGDVSLDLGDREQAVRHYQASLDLRREIGDRRGEGWMLHALSRAYAAGNLWMQARECAAQAAAIADECGDEELHRACVQANDQLPTEQ
jgi:tetratricopeptide (TPR) repeat protein